MARDLTNLNDDFKKWHDGLISKNKSVHIIISGENGVEDVVGDVEMGLEYFKSVVNKRKRESLDWIPPANTLKKLSNLLREY